MSPNGPSTHLSWAELACWNRLGHPWGDVGRGAMIAEYPHEWRNDRAVRLAATFEQIRQLLGHAPIAINSAYRTSTYNKAVDGVKLSQHVNGRALDLRHSVLSPEDFYVAVRRLEKSGLLPMLGGIGCYRTFVHIDVRQRPASGRVALWYGSGLETRGGIG